MYIQEKNEIFSYVFLERSLHILKRIKFEKYKKRNIFLFHPLLYCPVHFFNEINTYYSFEV